MSRQPEQRVRQRVGGLGAWCGAPLRAAPELLLAAHSEHEQQRQREAGHGVRGPDRSLLYNT